MRLNLISHYDQWVEKYPSLLEGAINVPASPEAALALTHADRPCHKISEILSPSEYQSVWKEGFIKVWGLLSWSRGWEKRGLPNAFLPYAYSFYILYVEIRLIWMFLDRCKEKYGITEISIENKLKSNLEPHLFASSTEGSFIHKVAFAWAEHRKGQVTISMLPIKSTLLKHSFGFTDGVWGWEWVPLIVSKVFKRFLGILCLCVSPFKLAVALFTGTRFFVFFEPNRTTGLDSCAPSFAINLIPFLWIARKVMRKSGFLQDVVVLTKMREELETEIMSTMEKTAPVLVEHFRAFWNRTASEGYSAFRFTRDVLKKMKAKGLTGAFLRAAPFFDDNGWVSEAFRSAGCHVAGLQHGGNFRIFKKAGVPHALTDFLGGIFFQWGNAATDEHETYGLFNPCRFISTGSARSSEIINQIGYRFWILKNSKSKPLLLYAPMVVSGETFVSSASWDSYIPLMWDVLKQLDASTIYECYVKLPPILYEGFPNLSKFPRLKFIQRGSFSDLMAGFDCLLVDGLHSSPIYEALLTDKPILVFAGLPLDEWDETFLTYVHLSTVCSFSRTEHLLRLKSFLEGSFNSFSTVNISARKEMVQKYLRPESKKNIWKMINNTLRQKLV